ncbi:protein of unknown function [Candidatus Nitrosocosmicus franklandus]|uniref:Uncharacterized protein n=1 Tax=Candidatus Nitrosocosmicus franklandianus TaxID=1798806 RepID=A0A484I696_9ARCH|nr:protein of unknown function [Candidatus Nitrosocosmicus franklandus]
MARCSKCQKGLHTTYIRLGPKAVFTKLSYYCINCKSYTENPYTETKPYTENNSQAFRGAQKQAQNRMLRPGFEPGICDSKGRNA